MKATSVQDAFEKICAMEAPLHERMAAFSEAVREFGLPYAEAYDDLVARIRSGEAGRDPRSSASTVGIGASIARSS